MGVSDQEGAAALNDVPNVFAKESRAMPARLAGGERRRRRSSGSDAEEPVLRGARSARLAVRLAIGMDPHLIEEWTRNQCEDREGDPSEARVRRWGTGRVPESDRERFDGAQDKECV